MILFECSLLDDQDHGLSNRGRCCHKNFCSVCADGRIPQLEVERLANAHLDVRQNESDRIPVVSANDDKTSHVNEGAGEEEAAGKWTRPITSVEVMQSTS